MGSDISRSTFDPAKHYSAVRQQQGRVNLDADWNEQVDISRYRAEIETADVIGRCGVPRDHAGFQFQAPGSWAPSSFFSLGAEIIDSNGAIQVATAGGTSGASEPVWKTTAGATTPDGSSPGLVWQLVQQPDVMISPGRMYVDGLLCELNATPVPIENFTGDGTGAPGTQVQVSLAAVELLNFAAGQWVQISAQGSSAPAPLLVQITAVNAPVGSLTFGVAVNGFGSPNTNPQLQLAITYLTQPDYQLPPPLPTTGTSIVYLDVWERVITALEDPELLEIALGGPDTTTRTKTVWQVKLVDVSSFPGTVSGPTPDSLIAPWERVIQPSALQLTTGVVPSASSGPCSVTSNTGFTGMENQLYRVEIHASGVYGWKANTPYPLGAEIVDSNGNLQIVTTAGTSGQTAPQPWATSVDAYTGDGGVVWQLLKTGFLQPWTANKAYSVGAQVLDQNGNVETAVTAGTSGNLPPKWLTGAGPSIQDGTSGLMWQFDTPTFKWSRENASVVTAVTGISPVTNTGGNPASRLTVASLGRDQVLGFAPGNWVEITDDWQELNRQPGELHLIDSIDVTGKTVTLNSPVTSFPAGQTAPSRHTRLIRWDQSGQVYLSDGKTVWTDLGAAGSTGDIPVPPAGTTLLLENGVTVSFSSSPLNGPMHTGDYWNFAARTADGSVELLTQASPRGIQHHYSRLGAVSFSKLSWNFQDFRQLFPPLADAGVHVTGVFLSSGQPLLNDGSIGIQTDLSAGINVVCDAPLDPATITQLGVSSAVAARFQAQATCFVSVDVPVVNGGSIVGFNPLILPATVSLNSSQPNIIAWTPLPASIAALAGQISGVANQLPPPGGFPVVLARLTLKGNYIWAQGNPHAYLQGNVLGTSYNSSGFQQTGLQFPSGSGQRGGNFETWFWLNYAPPVSVSAASLNFGNQLVGAASPVQTLTLTNNNASSVGIAIVGPDFTESNTCAAVPIGQSCTINVTFTPSQAGPRTAQLNLSAGGALVQTVTLTGNGIQAGLSASVSSLAFGLVTVGAVSAPQTVTLTNTGTATLTISGISISGDFTQATSCGSTLTPGATCTITVTFVPAAAGALAGTLTIASNAPASASPPPITLSGTGIIKTKDSKDTKDSIDGKLPKDTKDRKDITVEKNPIDRKALVTDTVLRPASAPVEGEGQEEQGTRKAFIQPEERPPVGQKARDKADDEHNE